MLFAPSQADWLRDDFVPPCPWDPSRPSLFAYLSENGIEKHITLDIDKQDFPPPFLPDEVVFSELTGDATGQAAIPSLTEFYLAKIESGLADDGVEMPFEAVADAELYKDLVLGGFVQPVDETLEALYTVITTSPAMEFYHVFAEELMSWEGDGPIAFYQMCRWLALNAPDREAVKFGLMGMSIFPWETDDFIYAIFARDESFLPYCYIRLRNRLTYEEVTADEFEKKFIGLYQMAEGRGRDYLLTQFIIEDQREQREVFASLWAKMLPLGPSHRFSNLSSSLLLFNNMDFYQAVDRPQIDDETLKSVLHVLKNLFLMDGKHSHIHNVERLIPVLDKVYDHLDRSDLNITTVFMSERIYEVLTWYIPWSDQQISAEMKCRKADVDAIRQKALDFRTRHGDRMREIVVSHYGGRGHVFPDMLGHVSRRLGLLSDENYWDWHFEQFQKGGSSLLESCLRLADDKGKFVAVLEELLKQNRNQSVAGIPVYDIQFLYVIEGVFHEFLRFPDALSHPAGEECALAVLRLPDPCVRETVLGVLADAALRPCWTSAIRSEIEDIRDTETDDDIQSFLTKILAGNVHE
ncbi:hypothetical protein [Micavibrio aeruginosavorus]|uniref:hypothetical protein n=1 Tax=Micavibrio aeruginosavorus TaxID=349221 RepID=UPI003F4A97AD